MSDSNKVNLPSLDAVDGQLDVQLTISIEEAMDRIGKIELSDAANSKAFLGKLLNEVEAAKKAKMSGAAILGMVVGIVKKVVL